MALKKGNKVQPVTLLPYHQKKLKILMGRTNLSASGVIQRLLENHDVFGEEIKKRNPR